MMIGNYKQLTIIINLLFGVSNFQKMENLWLLVVMIDVLKFIKKIKMGTFHNHIQSILKSKMLILEIFTHFHLMNIPCSWLLYIFFYFIQKKYMYIYKKREELIIA